MSEQRRSPSRQRRIAAAVVAALTVLSACSANPKADQANSAAAAAVGGTIGAGAGTTEESAPSSAESAPAPGGSAADEATASAASAGASGSGEAAGTSLKTAQFVNPLPQQPQWRLIGDCMADEAKARGVDLTESGPTGGTIDAATMIQQLQQAIANKKGAVITLPASDAFAAVLQQAQKADIITATMYGDGTPASGADTNIGLNWAAAGELYVKAIAEREGQQVVGLMAAGNTGVGKSWMDGVKAAAKKTGNVKVVAEVYTGDDAAKALDQATALLTAHPDVTVIATHMGTVTQGAIAAIKAKGRVGKTVLVGAGAAGGGKEGLADGTAYRILMQGLCSEGKQILDAVADLADGKDVPNQIDVKTIMATADDVAKLQDQGWG